LLPTYNRAATLKRTLDFLDRVSCGNGHVRVVVIDNCCTDNTKEIVESHASDLVLEYFFAARAGKSKALNDAISSVHLDDIVVFIDDDVLPCDDWLVAVRNTASDWPDHSVFGGKITPLWPGGSPPVGMRGKNARTYALGAHDLGDEARLYPGMETPIGMNFWLRKAILEAGHRFDETIGPLGNTVIMGEDTDFLLRLREKGCEIVYSPNACVNHAVEPHRLEWKALCQRAYAQGRGGVHAGLCHSEMLCKTPLMWFVRRATSYALSGLRYWTAGFSPSDEIRAQRRLSALGALGYNSEALRRGYARYSQGRQADL
jgi:glycosyltransferase involved in cell wall biosynthesis